MFNLIFDMKNIDGIIIHMEFGTASDFLEQCESDDIDYAISFDNELSNVTYGYEKINCDTVEDLYNYLCEIL